MRITSLYYKRSDTNLDRPVDNKIKEPVPFGTKIIAETPFGLNPKKQIGSLLWFILLYKSYWFGGEPVTRSYKVQAIPIVSAQTKERLFISSAAAFAYQEKRQIAQARINIPNIGKDFLYLEREANLKNIPLDQLGLPNSKEIIEILNDRQKRLIFAVFILIEGYLLPKKHRDTGLDLAHLHLNEKEGSPFDTPVNNQEELIERINSRIFGTFFSVFFYHNDWFNEIVDQLLVDFPRAEEYEEAIRGIIDWVDHLPKIEAQK